MLRRAGSAALLVLVCLSHAGAAPGDEEVAGSWVWELPPGFPEPSVPADNPMSATAVELGRRLFHDTRLSRTGTASCASCHRQALAFTDGRARAIGATGALHPRSAMSLANVAYAPAYGWAQPDLQRLEDQAAVPMFNERPVELGLLGHEETTLERLARDADYARLFPRAFPDAPDPITLHNVRRALASFERTLISGDSPYDRLVYRDERAGMSSRALHGMRLFFSHRLGCATCHHGLTFSGPIVHRGAPRPEAIFENTGLYNLGGLGAYPPGGRGLAELTARAEDEGHFRIPTLRNIALTAPYMHDGSVASLAEVIEHYAAGGRNWTDEAGSARSAPNPHQSPRVGRVALEPEETAALVAFLESLTDAGFATDARFGDPSAR